MPEKNKALIRQFISAISGQAKPDSILNIFIDDLHLKHHIQILETAFPRYQILIEDLIAEEDKVAVRATLQGIHRHVFQGIAPTSRKIKLEQISILRIARGKIVEHWTAFDEIRLRRALGVNGGN